MKRIKQEIPNPQTNYIERRSTLFFLSQKQRNQGIKNKIKIKYPMNFTEQAMNRTDLKRYRRDLNPKIVIRFT